MTTTTTVQAEPISLAAAVRTIAEDARKARDVYEARRAIGRLTNPTGPVPALRRTLNRRLQSMTLAAGDGWWELHRDLTRFACHVDHLAARSQHGIPA